jgi:hypothetical protein
VCSQQLQLSKDGSRLESLYVLVSLTCVEVVGLRQLEVPNSMDSLDTQIYTDKKIHHRSEQNHMT